VIDRNTTMNAVVSWTPVVDGGLGGVSFFAPADAAEDAAPGSAYR
jgi:hypothetical protein